MSSTLVLQEVKKDFPRYLEEFRSFVRQPSISADGTGMEEACDLLIESMRKIGINTKKIRVKGGYPVVYGNIAFDGNRKTLLVHSHYDVQPVNPSARSTGRWVDASLKDWTVEPFGAKIIDNKIYGRGTVDNKGPLFAWLKAVEAYISASGRTPVNLIFLSEGENEIGSPNLATFVADHRDLFEEADANITASPGQGPSGRPVVNLGWKGILYVEVTPRALAADISSTFAPIVENPLWRLVEALNTLRNGDRVTIEGFYDEVEDVTKEDLELIRANPFDEDDLAESLKVDKFSRGLTGSAIMEAVLTKTTCNLDGLSGGYADRGMKTVLPAKAMAKIDFRLLPKQDPKDILAKLRTHFLKTGFEDMTITMLAATPPSKTPATEAIAQAVIKSARDAFGMEPEVWPWAKSNAPDYVFTQILGLPSLGCGCGFYDLCHGPNEYLEISQFMKGIMLAISVMSEYSKL